MAVEGRDVGREMLLEYGWGNNPAAAAAAMLLFGEEPAAAQETMGQERQYFDHYSHSTGAASSFFEPQPVPQQLTAAALFPSSCHQRYGLPLPPVAPALGRIGLNLGVRTYFSSGSHEEGMAVGRAGRRRGKTARCQAEGCGADLTHAKHYHRRHKVCEFHSKASIVIAAGLSQRFCQQCSRFHVLAEFDQGKRSCRKRLADHNRRRRKSQDLAMATTTINSHNENKNTGIITNNLGPEKILFSTSTCNNNNQVGCKLEPSSTITHLPSPPSRMALGLSCYSPARHDGGGVVVAASTGVSAPSPATTSPANPSFLAHLGDLQAHDNRFPSWDEEEEGSSLRGLFQNK